MGGRLDHHDGILYVFTDTLAKEAPMSRRRQIYEGKAKVLFEGPEPGTLVQHFKDDATAFNNKKQSIYGSYNQINAYRKAFKKSSGDIIFFLDSDDLFLKNKIENIVNYFHKNKKPLYPGTVRFTNQSYKIRFVPMLSKT